MPARGNGLSRLAARVALRVSGWRIDGALPNLQKFVVIIAPHTSNWDFLVGVTVMFALGVRPAFLGKDTLFRWPFGVVMRWLGGLPVDRFAPHQVVDQVIARFHESEQLVLALAPEGTRRKLPAWRTGFHFVARGASVPIVPVALDYPRRTIRILAPREAGADVQDDLDALGRLFTAEMARHPEKY